MKPMTDKTLLARDVLVQTAEERNVITFGALADRVGIGRVPIALNRMLDRIHNEDKERGRPSLASLVVSSSKLTMPSAWADNWTQKSWTKERKDVHSYYRKKRRRA